MAMHIDAHQHFWIYNRREYDWIDEAMASIRRDFLPADLKPQLETNGFQGSVLVQVRQTLEETRWLLELAENNPFILGVVGWVDLRSPRLRAELEFFAGLSEGAIGEFSVSGPRSARHRISDDPIENRRGSRWHVGARGS